MNRDRLIQARDRFLTMYPGGFEHPELVAIAKKHKMEKMHTFVKERFAKAEFVNPSMILEDTVRIIGRATMVSVFEKPAFKRFAASLSKGDRAMLAEGLYQRLYGDEKAGFEAVAEVLALGQMAKWTLISTIPFYMRPDTEVFVKPTTTKAVISHFELEGLVYRPRPSWEFYAAYREEISRMKAELEPPVGSNSAAFTGFLMMSMPSEGPGMRMNRR